MCSNLFLISHDVVGLSNLQNEWIYAGQDCGNFWLAPHKVHWYCPPSHHMFIIVVVDRICPSKFHSEIEPGEDFIYLASYWGYIMGYSRKKKQGWGVEDTLFWTSPGIFRFLTLPLEIPDKTKLHPIARLETQQNCIAHPQHPSENLRPKTKTPGNSTWLFLDHPWNSTLFLINPWKFDLLFLQYPWKFHLQLSNLVFLIAQLATRST